ncbi:hypothetical protein C8J56DRAFT_889339 [Mycena floridula]|nr:hypothetical protein C8J56DRAFT_889339 [Mycena floridula]
MTEKKSQGRHECLEKFQENLSEAVKASLTAQKVKADGDVKRLEGQMQKLKSRIQTFGGEARQGSLSEDPDISDLRTLRRTREGICRREAEPGGCAKKATFDKDSWKRTLELWSMADTLLDNYKAIFN